MPDSQFDAILLLIRIRLQDSKNDTHGKRKADQLSKRGMEGVITRHLEKVALERN